VHLDQKLTALITNMRKLIFRFFQLEIVSNLRGVGGSLFGLLIAAAFIFNDHLQAFRIVNLTTGLAFFNLFAKACQGIPDKLPMFNTLSALGRRMTELLDILLELQAAPDPKVVPDNVPFCLQVTQLSYATPDGGRVLARGLTFVMEEGVNMVLRGESGCGKTSLIRCIAGLWEASSGAIGRPHFGKDGVIVLPQRPYTCIGSLRQQVLYPVIEFFDAEVDAIVSDLLVEMGLGAALEAYGLDGVEQWEDVLSTGEQQRLMFARVLYTRPKFAILDEASSALDMAWESTCMQSLVDEDISFLTIAHRPSVVRFHDVLLQMEPDGSSSITPLVSVTPC